LLVTATVFSTLLPPAHIHLAEHDDHDHAGAVEHSHWSSHGASRAALDDDDGRAIYVDRPAIASSAHVSGARPATAIIALLILQAPAAFIAIERQTAGNSPRDGPTRTFLTLRAPPFAL
jgi:hypothetical protein